jgi:hypothetical protein
MDPTLLMAKSFQPSNSNNSVALTLEKSCNLSAKVVHSSIYGDVEVPEQSDGY